MTLFIFTRIYRVIVHISFSIIGNMLTPLFHTLYKLDGILLFFPCGTKFHTIFLSAGDVAERGASDQGLTD